MEARVTPRKTQMNWKRKSRPKASRAHCLTERGVALQPRHGRADHGQQREEDEQREGGQERREERLALAADGVQEVLEARQRVFQVVELEECRDRSALGGLRLGLGIRARD